jgi:hypothetical protein
MTPTEQTALEVAGATVATATLSADRRYRYSLHRVWDRARPLVMFVGLNPSTADETRDDPTIRRCIGFARSWGMGGIVMVNLYAYRATDPRDLEGVEGVIGNPANDSAIRNLATVCELVVCAWGAKLGPVPARNRTTRDLLLDAGAVPHVLGLTAAGRPRHPLYMRGDTQPFPWTWESMGTLPTPRAARSPLDSLFGAAGDPAPTSCRVVSKDVAVHWYPSAEPGSPCFCGARTRDAADAQ